MLLLRISKSDFETGKTLSEINNTIFTIVKYLKYIAILRIYI